METRKQVQQYYESGEYQNEITEILHNAWQKLKHINPTETSVVVIDIDETALSCYDFFKNTQFVKIEPNFRQWKSLGTAPAIEPVLHFYRKLIKHGFKIIFISCRGQELHNATARNLTSVGYKTFERIILRTLEDKLMPFHEYKKRKRAELAQEGWHVVACIGDQWSDLEGEHTGLRIKIPNYILSE